uniref:Variant surface glycoprotein n=1 Tax=Trypanosoma brucei TaxID=5691 RepID=A0A1V0FYL0_9TRYP|nr:variant surface glycoprotein [Trypanosoma brucei]
MTPPSTANPIKATKLRIYSSLTTEPQNRAKALLLATLHDACAIKAAEQNINEAAAVYFKAAGLAHLAGMSSALEALQEMQSKAETQAQVGNVNAVNKQIQPDNNNNGITQTKCTPSDYAANKAHTDAAQAVSKLEMAIKKVVFDETAASNSASQAMCCGTNGECASSNQGNQLSIKLGKMYKTEAVSNVAKGKDKTGAQKTSKTWYFSSDALAQQAAQLDHDINTAVATQITKDIDCNPWEQTDNAPFALGVYKPSTGDITATDIPAAAASKLNTAVEDLYGKDAESYKEKIWKEVDETQVTEENAGKNTNHTRSRK